jgi:hypothetical protein
MHRILRGLAIAAGFVAAYVLLMGALTYFNVVALGLIDGKFYNAPLQAWLEIYWPLWSIFYAPAAVAGLLAEACYRAVRDVPRFDVSGR